MADYEELTRRINEKLAERAIASRKLDAVTIEMSKLKAEIKTIDTETSKLYQERAGQMKLF